MPKKEPKERVQLEAAADLVSEWKREAQLGRMTLSEFIRRACIRYAAARQKKREQADKGE